MSESHSERDAVLETSETPEESGADEREGSAGASGARDEPPPVHGLEDDPLPEDEAGEAAEAVPHQQLQREMDALNERHLRLAAEFQNYRRRAEGEMGETWSRAQADLVRRFLDVLDDLQRVSNLEPSDEAMSVQAIVEGVDLVERKFVRALEDAGVEVVDPAGERFDPERMEAVMRVPGTPEEDDQVVQVFQRGYLLKGHLIRPARVSVSMHE